MLYHKLFLPFQVERLGDPDFLETLTDGDWNMFSVRLIARCSWRWSQCIIYNRQQGIYFILVTISTVGYGDITPATVLGRLFIIAFIISGIVFFSVQTNQVLDIVSTQRSGTGKFTNPSGVPYILICGDITRVGFSVNLYLPTLVLCPATTVCIRRLFAGILSL